MLGRRHENQDCYAARTLEVFTAADVVARRH